MARYPGSKNPTRRALGVYDKMKLEEAREKAREWLKLIARGIDPETAEEAARQAELRKIENTFVVVAEEFFKRHLSKTRQGHSAELAIRREFISRWATRPIAEITRRDVLTVIDALVDSGKPYAAHVGSRPRSARLQLGDCSRHIRARKFSVRPHATEGNHRREKGSHPCPQ